MTLVLVTPLCSLHVFLLCVARALSWPRVPLQQAVPYSWSLKFTLCSLPAGESGAMEQQVCFWKFAYSSKSYSLPRGIIVIIITEVF